MIVPDEVLQCVVFIGCENKKDGGHFYFGSAFFVGRDAGNSTCDRVFLVTARHVIDNIRKTGATEVCIRVNLSAGGSEWQKTAVESWFSHPTDKTIDVAILEKGIPAELAHRVIPHTLFVTHKHIAEYEIGLGEELFITGLFKYYKGSKQNIPIVRIGNLACAGSERVETEDYGEILALLAEVRSLGGLSGSPVFLNLGRVRVIRDTVTLVGPSPVLLQGLIHGHFESKVRSDAASHDEAEKLNVGIAVVVPINSIMDVILAYFLSKQQRW